MKFIHRPTLRPALGFGWTVVLFVCVSVAGAQPSPEASPEPSATPSGKPSEDQRDPNAPVPGGDVDLDPVLPPDSDTPRNADSRTSAPYGSTDERGDSEEGTLLIEILSEPEGDYLDLPTLITLLRSAHPEARGQWDGALGMVRITVGGRNVQALVSRPALIVDGHYRSVDARLKVSGDRVLIPLGTVKELMRQLGLEVDLAPAEERAAQNKAQAAGPILRHGADRSSSTPTPRVREEYRNADPGRPLLAPAGRADLPGISLPQPGAKIMGLTWGELTDYAHRDSPRRITIVSDAGLAILAREVGEYLKRAGRADVTLVEADGGRADAKLIGEIASGTPDLVLDLVVQETPSNGNADWFEIWVVNEALWPRRREARNLAARSARELYVLHQFQSLALAATVRTELAKQFPNATVRLEFAPSYLLRRVDAPACAIVIPSSAASASVGGTDRLARALAGGLIGYKLGMESALAR